MSIAPQPKARVGPTLSGVWLPIVTPFLDGAVDFGSYQHLLAHYLDKGIDGLILLGTTGESPTIEDQEAETLVDLTLRSVNRRLPVYVGIGGNSTAKVVKTLQRLERHAFDGILSVCPYYNRPSQDGLRRHFEAIAAATEKNVLLYNIPYRTGVNLSNDSVLALSGFPNIVGIKDSCADPAQSAELLRRRPPKFAVLTGDDARFHDSLVGGSDGGILAAAHYRPEAFMDVYRKIAAGDRDAAQRAWSDLEPVVRLLFKEPNPMPIKHWLWRQGLIASPECRLPMTRISAALAAELEGL